MILVGCRPKGRHIEQHDICFCIGESLKAVVPDIQQSWPGSGKMHIDAWREVTEVDGYGINVLRREGDEMVRPAEQLYFLNLGGYKPGEFEEYHYKVLKVSIGKNEAVKLAKQTAFYKHTGFKGAESHIDDKYGVDVDDIYEITDILPAHSLAKYKVVVMPFAATLKDEWHLGYCMLSKL